MEFACSLCACVGFPPHIGVIFLFVLLFVCVLFYCFIYIFLISYAVLFLCTALWSMQDVLNVFYNYILLTNLLTNDI